MEIIPFIKNLLIDSLAGISFRNLPFIVLQLISSGLAVLIYLKVAGQKESLARTIALGIAFTALFIIAFTSVPLSVVAGFIAMGFLAKSRLPDQAGQAQRRKDDFMAGEQSVVIVLLSYAAGSGHLILLVLSLIVIYLFYRFIK